MCKTKIIQVRFEKRQLEQLQFLAESQGYSTVSAYVRAQTVGKPLSVEHKLNKIINLLQNNGEGVKDGEGRS